jgi:O-antigen/teichoic acid export membrane protein
VNRYRQLVSNTLLFALGSLGSKFLVFLLVPLYTNEMTTAEYGISEIVITLTNLLIPLFTLSIQDATLRYALDKDCDDGEVIKGTISILVIGSVISFACIPLYRLYKPIAEWSLYLALINVVYMVRNAFSIYLKAIGRTRLFALDSILYTALLMAMNIVLLKVFHMGIRGYFLAIIASSVASIIYLSIAADILFSCMRSRIDMTLLKGMLLFSIPMVFNNISWWVINSSDRIMVQVMMSSGAAGLYSVAAKMPSLITSLTSIFNQAWVISSVTEYDSTKDERFFSNTFSAFNCMALLSCSVIVALIKPFMGVYVGPDFTSSWQYVPVLLLGSIFQAYAMFFGAIYTSARDNVGVMLTTFMAAGINFALNIILIPSVGIQGAAVATAVAYLAVAVFRMRYSQRYVHFKIDYTRAVIALCALMAQCLLSASDKATAASTLLLMLTILVCNIGAIKSVLRKASGIKLRNGQS